VMPARLPRAASAVAALAASGAQGPSMAAPLPTAATAATLPVVGTARATPAAAATPADPAGPRARCGERNFIAMLVCMKRECDDAALRGHPECVKMREQEEAQRPGGMR
jgi:hypothetical protein